MDRRSFLKGIGITAAAVAVPSLVLPSKAIALPEPNRTFFTPPEQGWLPGESALEYIKKYELSDLSDIAPWRVVRPSATHYRITGFYDPDVPLVMPGETVLLRMPRGGLPVRAMVTEYTTEMYTDRAATISVKFVGVRDGPEPTTEVNMHNPISWTTWSEMEYINESVSFHAGISENWLMEAMTYDLDRIRWR